MSKFIRGNTVTVNGREAKVLGVITETTLKIRFEGEYHADIVSVDDISGNAIGFDFKTYMS
ncbi:hypothetical protein [Nocardia jiangxiensis]|uniref:hypothetical protein n=1 Tax=Nocardia jiangxiensis TaxID=282685 RepID=UPI0005930A61|nr:hypothetical protein [Nocardia jiangxiensis]